MKFMTQAFIFIFILTVICSAFYNGNDRSTIGKSFFPVGYNNEDFLDEARKKHKEKFAVTILMGALMIKAILLTLALKAMTVMSSIAVLLSTMSLIVSSIVGFSKLAWSSTHPTLKVVHVNDATWAKDDDVVSYPWGSGHYPDGLDYSSIPQLEHHIHRYQK